MARGAAGELRPWTSWQCGIADVTVLNTEESTSRRWPAVREGRYPAAQH
ncbi:MAG: hypothetical protein ACRDRR_03190 [Pseudonocardiaceae bacterium]